MSGATILGLIEARASERPDAIALDDGTRKLSYGELLHEARRVAAGLEERGVVRGDRVAILSENSIEYALCELGCSAIGAIAACLNWRLAAAELSYCVELVDPRCLLHSERYSEAAGAIDTDKPVFPLGSVRAERAPTGFASPDDDWIIIYTSGTTGLPKAALISQQAEIARMCTLRLDLGLAEDDGFVSWTPMFHMGGSEHMMATLMSGGTVHIVDGFQPDRIAAILADNRIGWLLLVPATILPVIEAMRARSIVPSGLKAVGCMADLVPQSEIAEAVRVFEAPFLNTFGSTETGMGPLSGNLLGEGSDLGDLAKTASSLSEMKLCDADGNPVARGEVGEMLVRGPGLFSGYWNADEANADAFRDGWYRMGDLFSQRADGRYEYAGRSKYLIKSGGENIYPAEIERHLLADPRIEQAVVVRRPDERWGEVPVAVIVAREPMDERDARALVEGKVASFKMPRAFLFATGDEFDLNVSGKPDRAAIEKLALARCPSDN
ncbi:acid--CoA ligase [Novosphingobium marinum]|uniref:Fatty-acyl-CoA synthase n=1 Tax=Novosphingobium marinum TaxID=1514948 RepID=A0A7Z0BU66_9SPHN|nr:class I adenylate-forming enzyme family protein [Novosphingobium marinum]NYH96756.1 fatty-acyl-CoA synthase [Novosphingobium marinum]GGC40464.1 acid--CoA ligase [Novosphingobium marinum]